MSEVDPTAPGDGSGVDPLDATEASSSAGDRENAELGTAEAATLLSDRVAPPTAPIEQPLTRERRVLGGTSNAEVLRELGRGGIGRVVLAHDERTDREIALKELLGDVVRDSPTERRFFREARITSQLDHPGIVPVLDMGRSPDGTPYYTMRVIAGRTLGEALRERKDLDQRLTLLPALLDVCQTMAYAHAQHVVHRDLKPANIMIGAFGETLVVDWGLAKVLDPNATGEQRGADEFADDEDPLSGVDPNTQPGAADGDDDLTRAGSRLGTPAYMSPEQAKGELHLMDARTDVWAIGVMLFELLSGERPFGSGPTQALLFRVALGERPSVADAAPRAPKALAAICERCLALKPDERYADAGEVAAELQRFTEGQLVRAYEYSRVWLAWRWTRGHAAVLGLAGLAVCLYSLGHIEARARSELMRSVVYADRKHEPIERSTVSMATERERIGDLFEPPTAPGNAASGMVHASEVCDADPVCATSARGEAEFDEDKHLLWKPENDATAEAVDTLIAAGELSNYQYYGAVYVPQPTADARPDNEFSAVRLYKVIQRTDARARHLLAEGDLAEARRVATSLFTLGHHLNSRSVQLIGLAVGEATKTMAAQTLSKIETEAGNSQLAERWQAYSDTKRPSVVDLSVSLKVESDQRLVEFIADPDIMPGVRTEALWTYAMRHTRGDALHIFFGPFDDELAVLTTPGLEPTSLRLIQHQVMRYAGLTTTERLRRLFLEEE